MKRFFILLIGLVTSTVAWSQILKTETDAATGKEIRSAVTLLGNGMGHELNFFSKGNERLIEFVEGRALESWPMKILKTMSINIKLKNDSVYHFPVDTTKYTAIDNHGAIRSSIVAVVNDDQLTPLLNNQVRAISLGFGDGKDLNIPAISDNNRREIKRAVAYILGNKR
ncbi:hypothetical protein [Mucilaginibacter boryungensis]|uniref:Uncharacterized protein n=1 Tax=Mucilaginibacter boryungensis TaxID=768480 RepID=A0ABR9XCV2_9SPHI|nr:hypothetical protein [Mucilaginibacter boryungensis]MBE9664884.1 hypothetical protein [Mucilaginibacter boryungensis]